MIRIRFLFTGLFAATILGITACQGGASATDQLELPPVSLDPGEVVVLRVEQLTSGPLVSGSLEPDRQATLRAEIPGVVRRMLAEPGQAVSAGQLLAQIDEAGVVDATLSARSAVRTATEALAVAAREEERSTRLAKLGATSERDLEQAHLNATNAQAALDEAKARLANAETQLRKTRLTAPFAGVVSERSVRAGDVVQVGNPVLTVVDLRSLRLEATVPVAALSVVRTGTEVNFEVAGVERNRIAGKITRVNPVVDPDNGQVRITVTVPNDAGDLVGGLFAQGSAATESREALGVPASSIDDRGLSPTVRRIRGGLVEVVPVELGLRDDVREMVEIVAGLSPGDTILVMGSTGLPAGTRVVVTKE
jgi:RND family efflux transporter MFP subunit